MGRLTPKYAPSGKLTADQIWYHALGDSARLPGAPVFASAAEAKENWFQHRAELLARRRECGELSAGYLHHELGLAIDSLANDPLANHGLLEDPEDDPAHVERGWPCLACADGEGCGVPCGSGDFLAAQQLTAAELRDLTAHFDRCSRWHALRGRHREAVLFEQRSQVARQVLAATGGGG